MIVTDMKNSPEFPNSQIWRTLHNSQIRGSWIYRRCKGFGKRDIGKMYIYWYCCNYVKFIWIFLSTLNFHKPQLRCAFSFESAVEWKLQIWAFRLLKVLLKFFTKQLLFFLTGLLGPHKYFLALQTQYQTCS